MPKLRLFWHSSHWSDGLRAVPASVSKTCLVRFDNNRYSVAASAVGRPVEIHAYANRIELGQGVHSAPKLNFNNCFFKIFRDKNVITINEAYALLHKCPDNKRFIRNKLIIWRKQGLAEPIYEWTSENSTLVELRLTSLGQSYFQRAIPHQASKILTASELLNIVAELKKQQPDIDVTFELRWMSNNTGQEIS
jgi:Mu transposase-like protein